MLVLATFTLVTSIGKKATLEYILSIHYLVQFWKNKANNILALVDLKGEFNAMLLVNTKKLGLQIQKTNIGTQKINISTLKPFKMIIASF